MSDMSNSPQLINAAQKRARISTDAPEHLSPVFPSPLAEFIDLDDPDLDYVIHSIKHLRSAGLDVTDPDVLDLAVVGGRKLARDADERRRPEAVAALRAEIDAQNARWAKRVAARSVVYYARLGNRVKIGYTANLTNRMANIQPEQLLATERGGPKLEAERHGQFASLRVVGEWFRYEQPLIDHVTALPPTPAVSLQPDRLPSELRFVFDRKP